MSRFPLRLPHRFADRFFAHRVIFAQYIVFALAAAVLMVGTAAAQDRRQNQAGKFDFYVLALSWAPTFCEASFERAPDQALPPECGQRAVPFVVHGLWPQYDTGFPEFCQQPAPRLDRSVVSSMLDLMPAPRLIFNEWGRHGTCSGLSSHAYFETVRKARALVKIPATIWRHRRKSPWRPPRSGTLS